ncbi:MAG: beta-ketoacyl synthase chain length factor, partial [Myxococcales bacterium]|nr:beta-ketoacyl synthase chain length factor [Myxococcales bacterium]
PTRFHNSVHNTAAGYLSIVTANRGVHTAIAAGRETAAMAVLEAACMVAAGLGPVLTIIVEEALPDVLAADGGRYEPLAVGLLLATEQAGRPRLTLRRGVVDVTLDPAQSPCAPALALHEAIVRATSEPRVVPLGPVAEGGQTWYAEVEAGDEHAAAT